MNKLLTEKQGAVIVEMDQLQFPTIYIGRINIQNSAELETYLYNREELACGDHPHDYWPSATRKLAAKLWNFLGRSLGGRASATRIIYDKGFHGGNQKKWNLSPIDNCPYCGKTDSNAHWCVECEAKEMRMHSADALEQLWEIHRTAPSTTKGSYEAVMRLAKDPNHMALAWTGMLHKDRLDAFTRDISINTDVKDRKEVREAAMVGLKILVEAVRKRWKQRVLRASCKILTEPSWPKHKNKKSQRLLGSLTKAARGTPMIPRFFKDLNKDMPCMSSPPPRAPPGSPRYAVPIPKRQVLYQTSITSFLKWNQEEKAGIG
jgi:hypothetical protein